eukprot:8389574-Alexandrium_andersonii.AAC.1
MAGIETLRPIGVSMTDAGQVRGCAAAAAVALRRCLDPRAAWTTTWCRGASCACSAGPGWPSRSPGR